MKHTEQQHQGTRQQRRPGPVEAFARFTVCGGGTTVASSLALSELTGVIPLAVANAAVTVAGTVIATELYRRFAFAAPGGGWRRHAQSAGTAFAAYLFTTAAMLGLYSASPHPSALWQQGTYLAASGLAGLGRFVVLRTVVFATSPRTTAARVHPGAPVHPRAGHVLAA